MLQLLRNIVPLVPKIVPAAVRIGTILVFGYVTLRLIDSVLNRLRLLVPAADIARVEQRTETLRHIIRSISKIMSYSHFAT